MCSISSLFEPVDLLLARLGIVPGNIFLYQKACIHRSFLNESPDHVTEHNERLEFLGDAALELAMTHLIYSAYPEKEEGWMTDFRSSYVRGTHLASIALKFGFDEAILMSQGERNTGGNRNPSILADMCEALLGALYLDQGFDAVLAFVERIVFIPEEDILEIKDPKSRLQEIIQNYIKITPEYIVTQEEGKDHEKTFHISASISGVTIGTGIGTNKKLAQESSAIDALTHQERWQHLLKQ